MVDKTYKTKSINKKMVPQHRITLDGDGKVVGRFATEIAVLLTGKDKPYYTPHADCGQKVVVTNAEKVVFTGRKEKDKHYVSYSGYRSGKKETTPEKLRQKKPTLILKKAVKGMLRKNRLGRQQLKNLHLYSGPGHQPNTAQTKQL